MHCIMLAINLLCTARCGFAGECSPRCIVPSEVKRQRSSEVHFDWLKINHNALICFMTVFIEDNFLKVCKLQQNVIVFAFNVLLLAWF